MCLVIAPFKDQCDHRFLHNLKIHSHSNSNFMCEMKGFLHHWSTVLSHNALLMFKQCSRNIRKSDSVTLREKTKKNRICQRVLPIGSHVSPLRLYVSGFLRCFRHACFNNLLSSKLQSLESSERVQLNWREWRPNCS